MRGLIPIVFVLSSLTLTVSSSAIEPPMIGHSQSQRSAARRHHGRRSVALTPDSAIVDIAAPAAKRSIRRRATPKKRCPAKTSSTSTSTDSVSVSVATSTTSTVAVVDNAAEDPLTSTSSSSVVEDAVSTSAATSAAVDTETEAPATTTKKAATTTTSSKAAETTASSDDGGSSGSGTYTGDATYYATGLGACGGVNKDTDFIAAASAILYNKFEGGNSNPNKAPICGKKGKATYKGKSVTFTIVDMCPPCTEGSLDFSPAAFKELADLDVGRLHGMTWDFI